MGTVMRGVMTVMVAGGEREREEAGAGEVVMIRESWMEVMEEGGGGC